MRMFLCLKDLFMDSGVRCFTAGRLYRECSAGAYSAGAYNDHNEPHYGIGTWGVFVETFERDNVTWIKHDGGDCPVPDGWVVDTLATDGCLAYSAGCAGSINTWAFAVNAYRIISTGEEEESGAGGGIELGDKDESEINDTKENLSLMDTLTQNQRDYITRKELEQAEKQQAQEQEKADEIEHKQQQSNDLVRANGVMK